MILRAGGSIANTGQIFGGAAGVGGTGFGMGFAGYAGYGVELLAGGAITNGAGGATSALIQGYEGVVAKGGPATITNFGTIEGSIQESFSWPAAGWSTAARPFRQPSSRASCPLAARPPWSTSD